TLNRRAQLSALTAHFEIVRGMPHGQEMNEEQQYSLVSRRVITVCHSVCRVVDICADEYARHGGDGELGWISILGDKRGTKDDFRIRSNVPHVSGKLDLHVSCQRLPRGYAAGWSARR